MACENSFIDEDNRRWAVRAMSGRCQDAPLLVTAGVGAAAGKSALVFLVSEGGAGVDAAGPPGLTPLHYAVYFGQLGAALLLLRRGADANARCEPEGPALAPRPGGRTRT